MVTNTTTGCRVSSRPGRTCIVVALLWVLAGAMPVGAAAGENCFATCFSPDSREYRPANSYLLMLASYYVYEDAWLVQSFDEFSVKFRELFTRLGLQKFDFIDIRKKTGDTQAVVMSNDNVVIVAFRGSEGSVNGKTNATKALYDWVLTDFNFLKKSLPQWGSGVRVHRGFYNAVDIAYPRLLSFVRDHLGNSAKKVWVTGHSLGAGLAPLAAFRLDGDGVPIQGAVFFGGARVGNAAFAGAWQQRGLYSERWCNDHDLVTMVPFRWMNYEHIGVPANIYADGHIVVADREFGPPGKTSAHSPGLYLQRMYNALPASIKSQVFAPPAFRALVDDTDTAVESRFAADSRNSGPQNLRTGQ